MFLMQGVFQVYDEDQSGNLDSFELRKALNSAGYMINNRILEALVLRYGDDDKCISFEDFIMVCVKLKSMIGNIN
jgi:Ca2+-binding EF-hand superfamily protein